MTGLPATMSGVQLAGHGGPEMLVWRDDIPVPRPGVGEVLVKVLAAGVNMTDINTRLGWYGQGEGRAAGWAGEMAFPRIQGGDLCGRVVALGDGVTDVAIGAMPCAYGTAHNLLTRAAVAVGERVLVTGASGGVGLAAVQLALLRGAEVTAQCSLPKSAPLRAIGATILPRDAIPRAQGFDVVIDIVGGEGFQDRLDALRPGGRYATSGAVGGPMVKGDLRRIYLNDLTIYGATHQPREVFAGLVTIINTARIRPVVSKTYPLRDIALAQADLAAGRYPGKLVLVPSEPTP